MADARTLPTAHEPPWAHLTAQQKVFSMVGTLLGMLLAALDQTVVATAGPAIQRDLAIEPSLYVWITTSYLVTSTVLVPIYGKLSDLYGRRAILLTGIGIFLVASVLCGIAWSTLSLILFRGLQGVGAAALFTSALAVVADLFPPVERGKYQGLFGAMFGVSSVVGPLVGGFLTDTWGWHWVFFVNLPIGVFAVVLILARMPPLKTGAPKARLDIAGSIALTLLVVPLLVALSMGKAEGSPSHSGYPWGSWQILSMFAVAAVSLVAFILVERRAAEPILDLGLFKGAAFRRGTLAAFVMGATFLAAIVFLPLFMVNVVGLSATRSGLTTTPLTLGIVFGNIFVGQLVSRLGHYKVVLVTSILVAVSAFAIMGFTLTPDSTQGMVTVKMIVLGLGLGPSVPLFTVAIQSAVPPQRVGVATSTVTFARQMGSTVGLALMGTIFATTFGTRMDEELTRATSDLPPALRERFAPAGGTGVQAEEGAPGGLLFDAHAVKQRISAEFAAQRERLASGSTAAAVPSVQPEAGPQPPDVVLGRLKAQEGAALQVVDEISAGVEVAFTDAIRRIYQACILIGLLAFLLTVITPEVPLRGGRPPPAME